MVLCAADMSAVGWERPGYKATPASAENVANVAGKVKVSFLM